MEGRLPMSNLITAIRSLASEIHKTENEFTDEQKALISDKVSKLWDAYSLVENHRHDLQDKAYALANALSNTSLIFNNQ